MCIRSVPGCRNPLESGCLSLQHCQLPLKPDPSMVSVRKFNSCFMLAHHLFPRLARLSGGRSHRALSNFLGRPKRDAADAPPVARRARRAAAAGQAWRLRAAGASLCALDWRPGPWQSPWRRRRAPRPFRGMSPVWVTTTVPRPPTIFKPKSIAKQGG